MTRLGLRPSGGDEVNGGGEVGRRVHGESDVAEKQRAREARRRTERRTRSRSVEDRPLLALCWPTHIGAHSPLSERLQMSSMRGGAMETRATAASQPWQ
eukprot:2100359-Pleurochrysis_carterae.AAC.3